VPPCREVKSYLGPVSTSMRSKPTGKRVDILGVEVDSLVVDELHARLMKFVCDEERSLVLHVNAHMLNLSYRERWLRDFLNRASIVLCDGAGVMLGARILGYSIVRRIPVTEWIWQLAEFAERHGFTFFFLGASPGVADKAATQLKGRFPKLRVVGVYHGYFDKGPGSSENEKVIRMINTTKPDFLIVGFGMPLQERWLLENWDRIETTVALTGGAVFDYASGGLRRGPRWVTDNGLEWLSRLIIEPKRLWSRYLFGNPLFLLRVLRQRLRSL